MSRIDHDKFKPPTCIPVRSEDIEYSGDTPYYIGVRPKELAVYPWPVVTVNTREEPSSCVQAHDQLTYMQAVYGYEIKNATYVINCYREDDEDPDDDIPPGERCERLTDYGGAQVKQGWLSATITNWTPVTPEEVGGEETPPTMPIPLQDNVRKLGHWRLATEEDELKHITIIEVGLLESIQVHVNSTLAKCNIYAYNLVYVENSALHESIIESDNMIHLDNMCQVKSDLDAPYILADTFSMVEGDGNIIAANKYLYLNYCVNFGKKFSGTGADVTTTIGRVDMAGNEYAYGISNIEVANTPCIKVVFSTLYKTNLSSPQMCVRGSTLQDCTLVFAKTSDKDDDFRNPSEMTYTYTSEIVEKEDGTTEKTQTTKTVPGDKLREGLAIVSLSDTIERFAPKTIKDLLFSDTEDGTKYVVGCTTQPDIVGYGQTIISAIRMQQFFPYATDLYNQGFKEYRVLVLNPITNEYTLRPSNPKLPYHSLVMSDLNSCTIEAEQGNFYSAGNSFNYSSVVADIMNIEGRDTYGVSSSLECKLLRGWGDNSENIVDFGNASTSLITMAKDIKIIAKFGSELTIEQEKINYGRFATLKTDPGATVTFAAGTFFMGDVPGPHKGNYKFEFLIPYPLARFEDTSTVTAEAIGLSPGNAAPSSSGPKGSLLNDGQITVGSIIGANITNRGILTAGTILSLSYNSTYPSVGKLVNFGGGTVKVQDLENESVYASEDTDGGLVNVSSINLKSVTNLDGGKITGGSIICSSLTCDGASTLNVAEIIVPTHNPLASLKGTIEGCSSLTLGDPFTSEEAMSNVVPPSSRSSTLSGAVSIGNLVARGTQIVDISAGSTIGTASLLSCACRVDWKSMGTKPEFFFSTNYLSVDDAKFYFSNQENESSLLTNCTFFGGLCRVKCSFSKEITFKEMFGQPVIISAFGLGSHTVSISNCTMYEFSCRLNKISEDFNDDGVVDMENFLSVDIQSSNIDLRTNALNTNIGGNLTVSESSISQGSIYSQNCSLVDSGFWELDIFAIKFSAANCKFTGGKIGIGGTMINCTYEGGRGSANTLAGITFTSTRFTRGYPNVGIVETINFTRTPDEEREFPPTYISHNPSFPVIQPQYERTTRLPDRGGPYTRSYIFEVENVLIYGPSLYEGVGLQNITIDMSASSFFEDDGEGNLVAVHNFYDKLEFVNCHIDNVTILNGTNIIFTNCMIENFVNKGALGVTLNSCGLIGSSFQTVVSPENAGTEIINCELFGVFASQGSKTIVTSSVGEFSDAFISSSDNPTYLKLDNGTINLNSIIFDAGAGFANFKEEEKLESISNKSDIEGRVDIINSSNSGLIYAKDINMRNSTNLAVGDMYASHFEWLGGNTNIGSITCSTFSGIMDNSEGIGDFTRHFNTRDGGATLVINSIGNTEPECFIYDYGPYYVFSNGVTTLNSDGSQTASESPLIEMDFNISNIGQRCLPATINVTESNEYLFNGARANTHGWHFHERRQYHFINNTNHPIGFVSPLPPGFSYTGSFLDGVKDGNKYYTGTITVMVGRPFVGTVTFESLYSTTSQDYRGHLPWAHDAAAPESGDDGQQIDPEPPPVSDGHPSPPPPDLPRPPEGENPTIPILRPGGVAGPYGTFTMASYNRVFGIRIFYVTERRTRQHPVTGENFDTPDVIFVEGMPFEGINIGQPLSFNNYVFNQIIYPDILETYFEEKATQLNLPRIFSTSQKYGFK